jgi:sulfhydrogenase subunit beta (sulfur reductase)
MLYTGHYTISKERLHGLLSLLSQGSDVYVPVARKDYLFFERFSPEMKDYCIDRIRPSEPIKSFLTRSRQKVDNLLELGKKHRPQVLAGVKNCDLASLRIQDHVFKDTQPQDPFYIERREKTLIISCDCNLLWESCFCVAVGVNPYPETGFDINLSRDGEKYFVEIGSDKGRDLVKKNGAFFAEAADGYVRTRKAHREEFRGRLDGQVREKGTPRREAIIGSVKKSYLIDKIWTDFASTCIECGGCNHCCPACHCFLLTDEKKGQLKARYKSWDACLYNRFARVAGGANPRHHLHERLRNRFDKKFEFFQDTLGVFGCTGCGRCIETCPGKIDIREVLKRTVKGA